MYLPLRIAARLADDGADVVSSTTTRSPVVAADDPRYAVRSAVSFDGRRESPDDEVRRHAYNLRRVDDLVVVVDRTARAAGLDGLLEVVRPAAERVLVVEVPDAHAVPGGAR